MWFLLFPLAKWVVPKFFDLVEEVRIKRQIEYDLTKAFRPCDECELISDEELLYGTTVTCPSGGCQLPAIQWRENYTCTECAEFKPGLGREISDDDAGWQPNTIWSNGTELEVLNKDDIRRFMEIKNWAHLKQVYNDIPFDQGGLDNLLIDWFRLLGCSDTMAEYCVANGEKPWEFDQNW